MSIGGVSLPSVAGVQVPAGVNSVPDAKKAEFSEVIANAMGELNDLHSRSDELAIDAATGDLESLTDYVVASTEAQIATQVTVAVRNKAVEAFNDIMRMPI